MNSTEIPARVFFHLTDVSKNLENGNAITVRFLATDSNCTQLEWMRGNPKDCRPATTLSTSKFIVVTATGKPSPDGKLAVNSIYRPADDDDLLEAD
ncbi:Serine--tRNA ligase [Trichinella spiralis]|uniref:Serine--tRNA ligase n=1 Tax=Trichinella spiralis TaxID=6334 RepID=A0ABR3K883_TRISP